MLAERLSVLRGARDEAALLPPEVGINSRLDSLQAAVLNVKLTQLNEWTNAASNMRNGTVICSVKRIGAAIDAAAGPARR